MQDDVLYEHFTVRECMVFASRLRSKETNEEQDEEVDKLIKELGIWNVRNTSVGSWKRKTISGGERKRCSIGVELIINPSLIMLDEPTSGLDSWNALNIVKTLQKLARERGKTIISTIHQPSSQAFAFFDRLILMADGHIVY